MTHGRQAPDQVVTVALDALDGSSPTVVSGTRNSFIALGYRFMPRRVMARISGQMGR